MQDYSNLFLYTVENYRDRNERNRYRKDISPPKKSPFPFPRMKPGQYFLIPIKNVLDKAEIESIRSFAHQHARIHNIWIKTNITKRLDNKGEMQGFVMQIIHDGVRKHG